MDPEMLEQPEPEAAQMRAAPAPRSEEAGSLREEVHHLWTHLQSDRKVVHGERLKLAFCSTRSGEGTTTSAASFARMLGEQGHSVCLVDANLRTPQIAARFGVDARPGLAEYLERRCGVDAVIRQTAAPGLSVVPAGGETEEVYAACQKFGDFIGELESRSRALILDCPPLSTAPEAGLILRSADATVLVVEANAARQDEINQSIRMLRGFGVTIAGAVLNRMRHDLPVFVDRLL